MYTVTKASNHSYGKNRTLRRMAELQRRADGWANQLRSTFMGQGVDVLFLEGSVLAVEAWCDQERLWRECIRGTMAISEQELRFVERLLADQGYRFGPRLAIWICSWPPSAVEAEPHTPWWIRDNRSNTIHEACAAKKNVASF